MPFNLIDAAKSMIPHELISREADVLGENENGIQQAFTGAIPAVLAGLLGKNSVAGAADLLNMVRQATDDEMLNGNSGSGNTASSSISHWPESLFGDRLAALTASIAGFAGISAASAGRVLDLATPAVLAAIGRYSKDTSVNAAGLSSYLQSQKAAISESVPSGLDLAHAFGVSSLSDIGVSTGTTVSSAARHTSQAAKQRNPWPWLLVLLAVVVFVWMLLSKTR